MKRRLRRALRKLRKRIRLARTKPCPVSLLWMGDRVVMLDGRIELVERVRNDTGRYPVVLVKFVGHPTYISYDDSATMHVLQRKTFP